jgi:hypothetical protein
MHGEVLPDIRRTGASLLVILKGDWPDAECASELRRLPIPVASWIYDSASRCPWHLELGRLSSCTYYVDGFDVRSWGSNSAWLPVGFDHSRGPATPVEKDIDVLLVGTVGALYTRRRRALLDLQGLERGHLARSVFVGSTGSIGGNMLLALRLKAGGGPQWLSRRLPFAQLLATVARAKVCVNVHQDDGVEPVNPLFFAVPGCRTCMVAEARPHLRQWLQPSVEYVEFDDSDLTSVVRRVLEDDAWRAAVEEHGFDVVTRKHTMKERVGVIIEEVGGRAR